MDDIQKTIMYQAQENAARLERTISRLFVVVILLIILLVGSNGAWLYYENSMEDVLITQENEGGYNNFIGNDGDITNN